MARLVAKGFQQRCGVDFNQTYAPVARQSSISLLLANGHTRVLLVLLVDVKNAFLKDHLNEGIYMRHSEGFVDNHHPHFICKLNRTLYNLKRASRGIHSALCEPLQQCRLTISRFDPTTFSEETTAMTRA